MPAPRPLSAVLSQTLVAFTIECNNEFERGMAEAGYVGADLSLTVWLVFMRFLTKGSLTVGELSRQALVSSEQTPFMLGCLERWRFITLETDVNASRPVVLRMHRRAGRMLREGWGSGRGIRAEWEVRPTTKGKKAMEIWAGLEEKIEQRWKARFGHDSFSCLREALQAIVCRLETDLPHGFLDNWPAEEARVFPPVGGRLNVNLSLATLLSQCLLVFAHEYNRESPAPLALSANILRVLSEKPVREGDIPILTGASPETSGIGWQVKRYVVVERDPAAGRGKVVRLTPLGVKAQRVYHRLVEEIEKRWGTKFGESVIRRLREALEGLFERRDGDRSLLAAGLVPPVGVIRAGSVVPALGRKELGAAARKRARDMVSQTEAFMRDPAGTLPHYPLWDMNRGFGP